MPAPVARVSICCLSCGKEIRLLPCLASVRKYCSRKCYNDYKASGDLKITNQFGTVEVWTEIDDDIIRTKYPSCSQPKLLAREMGRSYWGLTKRAKMLGVKRTKEAITESHRVGGRKNKGNKRPDFLKNMYRGSGPANPFYGKTHTEETRKKISEVAKRHNVFKRLNRDPEFQKKRIKGLHKRPNKPEKLLMRILDEFFPKEYKFTGDGAVIIDGLNPDFINVNGQKKIIEVFGETYHDPEQAKWKVSSRATFTGRKKAFRKFGYSTLIIWSQELYKGGDEGREKLITKIRKFHENCSY